MLEKNLEALQAVNPTLAARLRDMPAPENDGPTMLFLGPQGDLNLAYNNVALHDMNDPIGEARDLFDQEVPEVHREHQTLIMLYGLGLGYLLRRAFVSSKSQIVILEPYLEVIRQTLDVVDFSEEFASNRVVLITNPDEIVQGFSRFYLRGDQVSTVALPSYRTMEPEIFLKMLDEIKSSMFLSLVSQNTGLIMMEQFASSSLLNLPEVLKYPDAALMHDQFKGMPGVVVSAGPSLDRPGVLEALKANRDNLLIACVGQAAKALDKAGIVPDVVCAVEVQDIAHQLEGVSYLDKVNLVLLPQAHSKMFHLPTYRKFIAYSNQDPMTQWVSQATGQSLFGYNHVGTVSITAMIHLMKMGCNPIFFLGQDLAYPDGRMYAQNSVYQAELRIDEHGNKRVEMKNKADFYGIFYKDDEEYRELTKRKIEDQLIQVKGWNDELMWTTPSYEAFRKAFENICRHQKDYTLVNCSEGGAYMNGFEHLPFPEALAKYHVAEAAIKPDLEAFLQEKYQEAASDAPVFRKVYQSILNECAELATMRKVSRDGIRLVKMAMKTADQSESITKALSKRLQRLLFIDDELARMTSTNILINAFVRKEMFAFSRDYERKISLQDEPVEGDMDELRENLKNTRLLYHAVLSGSKKLNRVLKKLLEQAPPELLDTKRKSKDRLPAMSAG